MNQELLLEENNNSGGIVPPRRGGGDDNSRDDKLDVDWKWFLIIFGISFIIMPFPIIVGALTFHEQIPLEEFAAYNEYCDHGACADGIAGLHGTALLGWRYIFIQIHNAFPGDKWDIETYTWRDALALHHASIVDGQ